MQHCWPDLLMEKCLSMRSCAKHLVISRTNLTRVPRKCCKVDFQLSTQKLTQTEATIMHPGDLGPSCHIMILKILLRSRPPADQQVALPNPANTFFSAIWWASLLHWLLNVRFYLQPRQAPVSDCFAILGDKLKCTTKVTNRNQLGAI